MGEGGYLGLDESNHGRSPEIFVAVYSYDPREVQYGKFRKRKNVELPQSSSYRHIIIPEFYKSIFGNEENIRISVVATFIRFFQHLEQIIIDGTPRKDEHKVLEEILCPFRCPKIVHEPKADIHYPLVNKADSLARSIFHHYLASPKHERSERFSQTILTVRPEDFPLLTSP